MTLLSFADPNHHESNIELFSRQCCQWNHDWEVKILRKKSFRNFIKGTNTYFFFAKDAFYCFITSSFRQVIVKNFIVKTIESWPRSCLKLKLAPLCEIHIVICNILLIVVIFFFNIWIYKEKLFFNHVYDCASIILWHCKLRSGGQ